jgi:hypothetical protein
VLVPLRLMHFGVSLPAAGSRAMCVAGGHHGHDRAPQLSDTACGTPPPPRHMMLLMHFALPIPFDIPDAIWHAAGIAAWQPSAPAYFATAYRDALSDKPHEDLPIELVPIGRIAPPQNNGVARFLVDDRLLLVLQGFAAGVRLPAVLGQRPGDDPAADVQLVDGAHRFYASAAAGFTHLPVAIRPFWTL